MNLSRRTLIASTPLAAAALLAGCAISSNTVNGVTTITVNVAQIDAWGAAFANGAGLIAGLPGIAGTATAVAIVAVATIVKADLSAFDKAANGSVVLTFDSTSVPAAVASLLADGKTLLTDAQSAITGVAASAVQTAQTYLSAISTVVSIFEASLGVAPVTASVGALPMTEAKALSTLGVH